MSKARYSPICLIYVLRNIHNIKVYVGQTWRPLPDRWNNGIGYSGCTHLNNAIKKYGKDSFYYQVLTVCSTQEVADYWESYFIKYYDSTNNKRGYNIQYGGSTGNRGRKTPESVKKKIAKSMTGKERTEEHKKNIAIAKMGENNPMYGIPHTEEHKTKIANAMVGEKNHFYGKTHSEEAKKKMSEAKKGKTIVTINGKKVWKEKE